jgi:hypothetical protein
MWKEMVKVLTQNFLGQRGNSQHSLVNTARLGKEIGKRDITEHKPDSRDLFCSPFSAEMFILIKVTIRDYLVAYSAGSVKAAPG